MPWTPLGSPGRPAPSTLTRGCPSGCVTGSGRWVTMSTGWTRSSEVGGGPWPFGETPCRACLGVSTKPYLERRLGSRYIWVRELGNMSRELPPTLADEEAGLPRLRELAGAHEVRAL